MLLIPFTLWLCAMEGTSWGIRIQLSQLSHRNMNRKEAVKLIYKCINYQCQNLELSEGSWWASFTWSIPNATGFFLSGLCLHTSLIHTLTSSSSSYAFLSHTSLSQSEQDEDHFSNKTKFKKMFTHMCHCMPHSRIEYLVELRSYLLLELEEFYIESQHISLNIHL